MADIKTYSSITEEYLKKNLILIDGDVLLLDPLPYVDHPQFVNPNADIIINDTPTPRYTMDAIRLNSIKFPNGDRAEPYSLESKTALIDYLKTASNFKVVRFGSNYQSIKTKQVSIVKIYKWVRGTIKGINGKDIEEPGRYYLTTKANINTPYYVDGETLYKLTLDETPATTLTGTRKDVWNAIDVSNTLPEGLSPNEIDPSILSLDIASAQTFANSNSFPNSVAIDNPNVTITINQTITIKVYNAIIYTSTDLSTLVTNKFTDENINFKILNNGIGYYKRNDEAIRVGNDTVETVDTKSLYTTFGNDLPKALIDNANPMRNSIGMWGNAYWQKVKNNYVKDIQTLSWSALETFHSCKYKYYKEKYNHPAKPNTKTVSYEDKDNLLNWETKKQLYRGTIAHKMGEILVSYIVDTNNKVPLAEDSPFIKRLTEIGRAHLRGDSLEVYGTDYGFTKSEILTVKMESEDLNIIGNSILNVNSRKVDANSTTSFYTSKTKISPETPFGDGIDDPTFLTIGDKKFPVVGFVDAIYENNDGSLGIYDLKSNEEVFKYINANKLGETYDFKMLQTVWYLKFLRMKGIVTNANNGQTFDFRESSTPDDKITIFFDFTRFSGDPKRSPPAPQNSPNFDIKNGRLTIRQEDYPKLKAELEKQIEIWVNTLEQFQLDPNQSPELVFAPTIGKYCSTCSLLSICPAKEHVKNKAKIARERLLNNKMIQPPIVTQPKITTDEDEKRITQNIGEYVKLSTGENTSPVVGMESKDDFAKRERKLTDIDESLKTQIGSIYLTSSIINISINDQKRHTIDNTLRTPSPMVFRMEGVEKHCNITIRFDSATKINTELRHILAQYIAFPFISIRNAEITRSLMPFDTHVDFYYGSDSELQNLVKQYFERKTNLEPDRQREDLDFEFDPAKIKQRIYEKARLFFGITSMRIKPVTNQVDTLDMVMGLQLHDSFVTSAAGKIEYLYDSNAVMNQLAWLYNSNKHVSINAQAKDNLINILQSGLGGNFDNTFSTVLNLKEIFVDVSDDIDDSKINIIGSDFASLSITEDANKISTGSRYNILNTIYKNFFLVSDDTITFKKINPSSFGSDSSFFVLNSPYSTSKSNDLDSNLTTIYKRFVVNNEEVDIPINDFIISCKQDSSIISEVFGNGEKCYVPYITFVPVLESIISDSELKMLDLDSNNKNKINLIRTPLNGMTILEATRQPNNPNDDKFSELFGTDNNRVYGNSNICNFNYSNALGKFAENEIEITDSINNTHIQSFLKIDKTDLDIQKFKGSKHEVSVLTSKNFIGNTYDRKLVGMNCRPTDLYTTGAPFSKLKISTISTTSSYEIIKIQVAVSDKNNRYNSVASNWKAIGGKFEINSSTIKIDKSIPTETFTTYVAVIKGNIMKVDGGDYFPMMAFPIIDTQVNAALFSQPIPGKNAEFLSLSNETQDAEIKEYNTIIQKYINWMLGPGAKNLLANGIIKDLKNSLGIK